MAAVIICTDSGAQENKACEAYQIPNSDSGAQENKACEAYQIPNSNFSSR